MNATVEFDDVGGMKVEGDEDAVRKLYKMYMVVNTKADLAQSLADALEGLIVSGVVPSSSAKDGGPNAHSAQVIAADAARAALANYRKGE